MKKKILLSSLIILFLFPKCDTLKKVVSVLAPSELEMALGLKDALSQGLFRSFDAFQDPNGNPFVRFVFPGEAEKIEKTLRDLGLSRTVDQVTGKFTRATSSAVRAAKPIFLQSLKDMSIRDAAQILITDNNHAATEYFKTAMSPQLMVAFRPIVDSTINVEGANKDWSQIVNVYNKIPFISKPLEASLTDFIAARAIDGMFGIVANEEEQIRTKYEFRKTDLMKKVFGYAEEELKRRATKNP
jgi:ribosomal protein L30/L7E